MTNLDDLEVSAETEVLNVQSMENSARTFMTRTIMLTAQRIQKLEALGVAPYLLEREKRLLSSVETNFVLSMTIERVAHLLKVIREGRTTMRKFLDLLQDIEDESFLQIVMPREAVAPEQRLDTQLLAKNQAINRAAKQATEKQPHKEGESFCTLYLNLANRLFRKYKVPNTILPLS